MLDFPYKNKLMMLLNPSIPQINSELVKFFPFAKHVVMMDAGHNVHLEKPEEYVRLLNRFFTS